MVNTTSQRHRYHYILLFVVALGLALLFIIASRLEGGANSALIREGGIVENLSAGGYFLCVLVMLALGGLPFLKRCYYFHLLVLGLGLRELDFHDRFTTMGIFKSRFFISPDVPVVEKLIATAIILLLLYCGVLMMKNHLRAWVKALRSWAPHALALGIAMFLVVFSKSIDGLARKLRGISVELGEQATQSAIILEEILELGIPLFMLTGIVIHFMQQKANMLPEENTEATGD